ncbi:MAG TPA: endolytic transglycosylase MltG [Solirubrobacteraceae bacterium]|nr:endolytic transglycosylase MltG [Solirubrobacteraceae bacterium]
MAEDWSAVDTPPPRRPLRPRRPGREPAGRPAAPGRARRWPLAFLLAAVVAILAVGFFALQLFQPLHGDGGDSVRVSIPRGAGVSQAGDILAERGVVSSAFFFKLRAKLEGTSDIKPGNYSLAADTSYGDALAALTKGPPPPKTTDITITEGRTITEANRLLRRTSLRGSYAAAARRATTLRPQQFGAPRSVTTKEGFLFPATYKVRQGAPVSDLVAKQLANFRQEFARVDLAYARTKKLTAYDVLIIASMVEREAGVPKDRRLIASVIYNRLNQSIPLGIDATIRYQLDNWQRPLRMSELERDTPYNTRLRQGLPPTPIGNPGLASIRAAANPARTTYLYFVVKPCANGEHAFTRTDAEFQRAVQRYEEARQRQGGSPVDC